MKIKKLRLFNKILLFKIKGIFQYFRHFQLEIDELNKTIQTLKDLL